jgi:hypothetical protein
MQSSSQGFLKRCLVQDAIIQRPAGQVWRNSFHLKTINASHKTSIYKENSIPNRFLPR